MADTELPSLPAATTPLNGTELVYITQSGNSRKTEVSEVAALSPPADTALTYTVATATTTAITLQTSDDTNTVPALRLLDSTGTITHFQSRISGAIELYSGSPNDNLALGPADSNLLDAGAGAYHTARGISCGSSWSLRAQRNSVASISGASFTLGKDLQFNTGADALVVDDHLWQIKGYSPAGQARIGNGLLFIGGDGGTGGSGDYDGGDVGIQVGATAGAGSAGGAEFFVQIAPPGVSGSGLQSQTDAYRISGSGTHTFTTPGSGSVSWDGTDLTVGTNLAIQDGQIYQSSGTLTIRSVGSGGDISLQIDGKTSCVFDGSVYAWRPLTNASASLGTSTVRWNNVYGTAGNLSSLTVGNGGIVLDYATWPASDAAGYLKSDGAGNLSWDASPDLSIGDAIGGSTVNSVCYIDGSNQLANAAAFVFDGAKLGIGNATPAATLDIVNASDVVGTLVKANGSQTANISEWRDSSDQLMMAVSSAGRFRSYIPTNNSRYWDIYGSGSQLILDAVTANSTAIFKRDGANVMSFNSGGVVIQKGVIVDADFGGLAGQGNNAPGTFASPSGSDIYLRGGSGSAGNGGGLFTAASGGANGTDIAGSDAVVAAGQGTGTGNGGDLLLKIAKPGGSGSSLNSYTNGIKIAGADGAVTFNETYTFPTGNSTGTQYLQNDGAGNLSWATVNTSLDIGDAIGSATGNRVLISDGSQQLAESSVTDTELGYLSGVTSSIQTQLDTKTPVATAVGATPVDTDVSSWANDTLGTVVGTGGRVWATYKNAAGVYFVELTAN